MSNAKQALDEQRARLHAEVRGAPLAGEPGNDDSDEGERPGARGADDGASGPTQAGRYHTRRSLSIGDAGGPQRPAKARTSSSRRRWSGPAVPKQPPVRTRGGSARSSHQRSRKSASSAADLHLRSRTRSPEGTQPRRRSSAPPSDMQRRSSPRHGRRGQFRSRDRPLVLGAVSGRCREVVRRALLRGARSRLRRRKKKPKKEAEEVVRGRC